MIFNYSSQLISLSMHAAWSLGLTLFAFQLNMKLHIIAFALVVVSLSADAKDLGQYSW